MKYMKLHGNIAERARTDVDRLRRRIERYRRALRRCARRRLWEQEQVGMTKKMTANDAPQSRCGG